MSSACGRKRVERYSSYLYRVLKSVHPDLGISNQGMEICESLINDMFDRIMVEATRLLRMTGGSLFSPQSTGN